MLAMLARSCSDDDSVVSTTPGATFDGSACEYDGPSEFSLDTEATFMVLNTSDTNDVGFSVWEVPEETTTTDGRPLDPLTAPATHNHGDGRQAPGSSSAHLLGLRRLGSKVNRSAQNSRRSTLGLPRWLPVWLPPLPTSKPAVSVGDR